MADAPHEPPWPREDLRAQLASGPLGAATLAQIWSFPEWVHRRVETLEFRDDTTFRRRHSVHFAVPGTAPAVTLNDTTKRLVVLSVLRKTTLVNFDCRDEDGRAVPVFTTEQNGTIATAGMTDWAEAVLDEAGTGPLADEVRNDITAVVAGPVASQELPLGRFLDPEAPGRHHQHQVLHDSTSGWSVTFEELAASFLLVTYVDDEPGRHRILKFSYEEPAELTKSDGLLKRVGVAIGWRPHEVASAVDQYVAAESYHFEAETVDGVDATVAHLWVGPTRETLACVDSDTGGHPRVALHGSSKPNDTVAEVEIHLRPSARGWLRAAWFATTSSAAALLIVAWRIDEILEPGPHADVQSELAAATILAVVGGMAGLISRGDEHPLVSHLLGSLRPLAAIAALLPFIAASSLVVGPSGDWRGTLW